METIKSSLQKMAFIAVFSISAIIAFSPTRALAEPSVPTISVSGSGDASAAPDMALISLGVQQQAKTAREALNKNNRAMAAVLAALKAEGIADKDLQTSNFNIQPQYQYFKPLKSGRQQAPRIIGYIVANNLSVRIRDLANLGEIIDLTITLGVNSGGNIQFINENPEPLISQARQQAVKNAITKAQTLTSAAGVSLGKILSITESSSQPRPYAMAEMAMARSSAPSAVPVAAGENSYTVNLILACFRVFQETSKSIFTY